MEYTDSEAAQELAERAHQFMNDVVIPTERDYLRTGEQVGSDEIATLRERARANDVYCPQIDETYGGMGYDLRDVLPLFVEAGRSLLGAPAMRVDAPDEGNMHTLELVGTNTQKEAYLQPLVDGELVSGFAMTEPIQGAGSDPKMIQTTAEKDGDEWIINGHKWWTTNGAEADFLLVLARTDEDAHPYTGCSIILVDTDEDGVTVERGIPHLGPDLISESHAELTFDDVRVPVENTLGPENEGFTVAQQRLGPARLTHCMRYTGMAIRALDIAKAYMSEREAFGDRLAEKQANRFRIAEQEMRLHAVQTMVRDAAEKIDREKEARIEVAMSKVFAANVAQDTIDFAIQACGGNGIGKDLPLADFYTSVRQFRIVDGADEVHKRSIARSAFEDIDEEEIAHITRF